MRATERIERAGARVTVAAECTREETGITMAARFSDGVRWDASSREVPAPMTGRREQLLAADTMGAVTRRMSPNQAAR